MLNDEMKKKLREAAERMKDGVKAVADATIKPAAAGNTPAAASDSGAAKKTGGTGFLQPLLDKSTKAIYGLDGYWENGYYHFGTREETQGSYTPSAAFIEAQKKALENAPNNLTEKDVIQWYLDAYKADTGRRDAYTKLIKDGWSTGHTASTKWAKDSAALAKRADQVYAYTNWYKAKYGKLPFDGMNDEYLEYAQNYRQTAKDWQNVLWEQENVYAQFGSKEEYDQALANYEQQKKYEEYDYEGAQNELTKLTKLQNYTRDLLDNRFYELRDQYERNGMSSQEASDKANEQVEKEASAMARAYGYEDIWKAGDRMRDLQEEIKPVEQYRQQKATFEKAENIASEVRNAPDFEEGVQAGKDYYNKTIAVHDNTYTKMINDPDLTDDEREILYYLFGTDDDRTNEYYDSIKGSLNQREAQRIYGEMQGNPVEEFLFSIPAGFDQFVQGAKNWTKGDEGYIAPSSAQQISAMVREDMEKYGPKLWNGASLGQVTYDLFTTTANMLPSILAGAAANMAIPGAGAIVNGVTLGFSAGGHAYAEMLNAGYSRGQAYLYGILNGVSEAGLEYALNGIAALGSTAASKLTSKISARLMSAEHPIRSAILKYALEFGGDAASEGIEEGLQDIIDPFMWRIVAGEWNADDLDENGKFKGMDWDEILYSAFLGALTSLPFNATTGAMRNSQNYKTVLNAIKNGDLATLVDLGLAFENGTDAHALAELLDGQAKLGLKGKAAAAMMVDSMSAKLAENPGAADEFYVRRELTREGITGDSQDTLAKIVTRAISNSSAITSADKITLARMGDINGKPAARIAERVYRKSFEDASGRGKALNTFLKNRNPAAYNAGERASYDVREAFKAKKAMDAASAAAEVQREYEGRLQANKEKAADFHAYGIDTKTVDAKVDAESGVVPKKIVSVNKRGMRVQLEDGSVVDTADVKYAGRDTAIIYESIKASGMDAETANALLNSIRVNADVNGSALSQWRGLLAAYHAGIHNDRAVQIEGITDRQRQMAFNAGRKALAAENKKAVRRGVDPAEIARKRRALEAYDRRVAEGQTVLEDNVRTAEKLRKELHDYDVSLRGKGKNVRSIYGKTHYIGDAKTAVKSGRQSVSLKAMAIVTSSITGNDVYFYESEVRDGKRVFATDIPGFPACKAGMPAPNGFIDNETGAIYIDLNAGERGQGAILWTAAHELTHFLRDWNADSFVTLSDFLMEAYRGSDVDVEALIQAQIEKAAAGGIELTYTEAHEELVADAMQTMFTDADLLNRVLELKARDKGLVEKIHSWLQRVAAKLSAHILREYGGLRHDAAEARLLKTMVDDLNRIADVFAEGLVQAGENFQAAGLSVDEKSESAAPSDAVQYDLRSWNESEYVQERNEAAKRLAASLGVTQKQAKKYIDDINGIAKMIADDRVRLDYEPAEGLSSFVGNVEYGGSFDFSTLCAKRRYITGTIQEIQKRIGEGVLSPIDILKIRNMMKKKNYIVNCGLCYVEGSRSNMGKFAKQFIERYRQHNPDATWIPKMQDVFTPVGIENMRTQHPEVYAQYEKFWNNHGRIGEGDTNLFASQQKPKAYQMRTNYKGNEITGRFKDAADVDAKNKNGGIRIQSFSDFELVHALDMMQVIMDMSRAGLAGQAYTKVPEFAWMFGNTGLKINLSLIAKGVDADGKLVFDDVEGMAHDEAFNIRDHFSKNVGTILVTFDDAQLTAAMADDRIDFIIPFHRSQWKKSQYGDLGLPATTKDYTFMQNEKYLTPRYHEFKGRQVKEKASNKMPNSYWRFDKDGKWNAENYLRMCAEEGVRPKFYKLLDAHPDGSYTLKQDGSTDGYWKLLIDFKMYDNDGNGSRQLPVRPEFNMGATGDAAMDSHSIQTLLSAYEGGHDTFPVAEDVVEDFVKEYGGETQGDIRYSLRSVEPVQPSSNDWKRTFTTEEAMERYPNLWNVAADESEKRNPTQIASTQGTYRNIYNILKREGFSGRILDASSGLGIGTKIGREEYGFDVDDIEPYPDANYTPKYTDYSKLNEKYDAIISSAVLNVLPQDQRDALVVKMGELLNDGGRMFITTRGNDVESLAKTGKNIHLGKWEWIETARGSYQKGFTNDELIAYLRDALGDGFIVQKSVDAGVGRFNNNTSIVVTKTGETSLPSKYSLRDQSAMSDRELLSGALMDAAKTEDERARLKRYQKYVETLDGMQTELQDINDQVKTLAKSKDPGDRAKEKTLRQQGEKLANRINNYDKSLLKMEAATPLQNIVKRERKTARTNALRQAKQRKDAAVKKTAEHYKQRISDVRQEGWDRLAKRNEEVKESRQRERDRRASSDLKEKIRDLRNTMVKSLAEGKGKTAVPAPFVRALIDVCELIDPSPRTLMVRKTDGNGTPMVSDITGKPIYRTVRDGEFTAEQIEEGLRNGTMRYTGESERQRDATKNGVLARLRDVYDSLANSEDSDYKYAYDPEFSQYLLELRDSLTDKPIREMSRSELQQVYDAMRQVWKRVSDAKKLIGAAYSASLDEMRSKITRETNALPEKLGASKLADFDRTWMTNPIRVAREMSGYNEKAGIASLFTDIVKGYFKGEAIRMREEKVIDAVRKTKADKKRYADACVEPFAKIKNLDGKEFDISLMQAIQTLLTYEREIANENHSHLEYTTYYDNLELLKKGDIAEARRHANKANVTDEALIGRLYDLVNKDKWAVRMMDAAKKVLREDSTNEMNATSMELDGVPIAREKAYIPYVIVKEYKAGETENVKRDISVRNLGMTKRLLPNAKTPVLIEGIHLVLEQHIDDVARYAGLAVPARNWNAVFNYGMRADETPVTETINKRWRRGMDILQQAVADAQGPRPEKNNKLFSALKTAFVTATLMGNISVTIKQMASYLTAGVYLSIGALRYGVNQFLKTAATKGGMDALYERIDELTPLLYMRRKGLSVQEIAELKKSKFNWLNERLGPLSPANWIQSADVNTTTALFLACEYEVRRTTKPTDPSFNEKVKDLYEKVISDTQPMYDPLHRAEISKDSKLRDILMFKTQPIQNSGIVKDAVQDLRFAKAKYGKGSDQAKAAGRHFAKAVTSQLSTAIVFTAMTLLASAVKHSLDRYRDDDKDLTARSIFGRLGLDLSSQVVNTLLPVFGEIGWAAVEKLISKNTSDVISDPTLDMITETVNGFLNFVNKAKEGDLTYKTVSKPILQILGMCGIPAKNAENLVRGIWLHIDDAKNKAFFSFEAGVERTVSQQKDLLVDAIAGGDFDRIDEIRQQIIDNSDANDPEGSADNAIKASIKTAFQNGDITDAQARDYLERYLDITGDDGYWLVKSWAAPEVDRDGDGETDKVKKYDEFVEAVRTGENLDAVVADYVEHGAVGFSSAISSAFKEEYVSAFGSAKTDLGDRITAAYIAVDKAKGIETSAWDVKKEILDKWDYAAKNGTEEGYTIYAELLDAIPTGKNLDVIIKDYLAHGKDKSDISRAITEKYKPVYQKLKTNTERSELKNRLLTAYALAGYDGEEKTKEIGKW